MPPDKAIPKGIALFLFRLIIEPHYCHLKLFRYIAPSPY